MTIGNAASRVVERLGGHMNVVGSLKDYADFACGSCEHHFVDVVPPMEEKLPRCPRCQGLVRIFLLLVPIFWTVS